MKLVLLLKACGLSIFFLVNYSYHRESFKCDLARGKMKNFFTVLHKFSKIHNLHTNIHILFCTYNIHGFPNSIRGKRRKFPSALGWGDDEKFCLRGYFLSINGNLRSSDFDYSNFFQSSKQHSVNI